MTGTDKGCKPALPKPGRVRTVRVLGVDVPAQPDTIAEVLLRQRQADHRTHRS